MHELVIAESIAEGLRECRDGRMVSLVRLRIGQHAGVVPDILEFCFELATYGTEAEGARLEIEVPPGRDVLVRSVETV